MTGPLPSMLSLPAVEQHLHHQAQGSPSVGASSAFLEALKAHHRQAETELYTQQGRALGGVGVMLANGPRTGPMPYCFSPGGTTPGPGGRPGSSVADAFSQLNSPRGSVAPNSPPTHSRGPSGPIHEWEKGFGHTHNFQASSRSTRTYDVPPASRWSSMSYFETDPKEIRRHLDITNAADQALSEAKLADRAASAARSAALGTRQREAFRQQRLNQDAKHLRAGLPVRPPPQFTIATPNTSLSLAALPSSAVSGLTPPGTPRLLMSPRGQMSPGALLPTMAQGRGGATMDVPRQGSRVSMSIDVTNIPREGDGPLSSRGYMSAPVSPLRRTVSSLSLRVGDKMVQEGYIAASVLGNKACVSSRRMSERRYIPDIDLTLTELDEFEEHLTNIAVQKAKDLAIAQARHAAFYAAQHGR